MKVYFISGLGADRRAFFKIKLPPGYTPVYLDWITPLRKETLTQYAQRFSEAIEPKEELIIIGLSFGGMLACELAPFVNPKKIIIISSLANRQEQPWYFRLAGKFGLYKLISPALYRNATLLHRFLGAGDREMKAIVYNYVKNADPDFIRWSLHVIVHWQHHDRLPNLYHIHGSRDHLLPIRYVRADYIIEKGGHLMIMNHANEVNKIINEILAK